MKKVVEDFFDCMIPVKLEGKIYALMKVTKQILFCGGDSCFKIKHISKEKLIAKNKVPYSLICLQNTLECPCQIKYK